MSWLLTHDHHFVVHKLNFESTEQSGIMFHAIKLGLHIKDNLINSKRFVADKTKIVDAQLTYNHFAQFLSAALLSDCYLSSAL